MLMLALTAVNQAVTLPSGIERSDTPFYVGWGTLALLNAGLAQSKNRSGLGWFLASLVLGPLATLFLVGFCDKLLD